MAVTDEWLKDHVSKAKVFVTKLSQLPKNVPKLVEPVKKVEEKPKEEEKKVEKTK